MQAPLAVTKKVWLKMAVIFTLSNLELVSIPLEVLAKSQKPFWARTLDNSKFMILSSIETEIAIDGEVLVKLIRSARQLRISASAVFLP